MAQSRLERIGTIYSRTKSLLRGGAMKEEDKPIWYAIYEAFPPKVEPRFDRPAPKIPIQPIFYKEDIIRAKFQRENKNFMITSLSSTKIKTRTQRFIEIYQKLEKEDVPEDDLYSKAMEIWSAQIEESRKEFQNAADQSSNTGETKEEKSVDLKNIFVQ